MIKLMVPINISNNTVMSDSSDAFAKVMTNSILCQGSKSGPAVLLKLLLYFLHDA